MRALITIFVATMSAAAAVLVAQTSASGEVQSWNQGFEPVPPGYESWLAPNATPYTIDSAGK